MIDESLFILLLLMHRKSPPTTSDLTDPRSMLGNKLSNTHTKTHTNTPSNEAVKPAALLCSLSSSPLSLHPAVFFSPSPPARPGGLWEGDGFWRSIFELTLTGQRRGELPPVFGFSSLRSLFLRVWVCHSAFEQRQQSVTLIYCL